MLYSEQLSGMISQEIEQSFLGCLLHEPACFNKVAWFNSAFFGVEAHGKIFDAIKEFQKKGRDFCPQSIGQFFEGDDTLPPNFIRDLSQNVISTQSVKSYANHLLALHYRRMGFSVSERLRELSLKPEIETLPENFLSEMEKILIEARNIKTADNFKGATESINEALIALKNPTFGIHSGFNALHKVTGGFKPAELITIGGRPAMGKTAMGLTLAVNAARQGKSVLFFSLEMSRQGLWQRILSRAVGSAVHSGEEIDWQRVEQGAAGLTSLPLTIDDSSGLTVTEISSRATQFKRRSGLDMVVVDYLGFVKASDPKANKVHQIEEITQGLKSLAKTLQIPIILLCQLSRAIEGRDDKRPSLSDLRDSGAIEQDSDMVMFIYRDEYYPKREKKYKTKEAEAYDMADEQAKKGTAELIIAKNRQNVLATIDLKFSGQKQEFRE